MDKICRKLYTEQQRKLEVVSYLKQRVLVAVLVAIIVVESYKKKVTSVSTLDRMLVRNPSYSSG